MAVECLLFVCSWSAGGPCNVMLRVVPSWDRLFVFVFFGGGGYLGRVGVMGVFG